ncbi:DUF177 domain-containing protein [Nordella sp. HKS 07]|uniref:DUF177 domain-containing protein n=1 Tax=Nordella sp. HKS 07 TaxID=2712222 RepID=UPI0013E157A5|nr:DUF177 domain-containing protein [Nordella sp. HKS 07]QIG50913.1 DUF177 domain-containing protein [Nordella sp. HKS 07]
MQTPQLEFSRPLDVTRVPPQGYTERIAAEPQECVALAARFGLPAIHGLTAELKISRWRGEGLKFKGHLRADIDQICVVSLESFRSTLEDRFETYFLPAKAASGSDEAAIEEGDAEPFENGIIDMGEVVAEAMALALDPYPKKPGVTFADRLEPESEASGAAASRNPFAGLSRLKEGKG